MVPQPSRSASSQGAARQATSHTQSRTHARKVVCNPQWGRRQGAGKGPSCRVPQVRFIGVSQVKGSKEEEQGIMEGPGVSYGAG